LLPLLFFQIYKLITENTYEKGCSFVAIFKIIPFLGMFWETVKAPKKPKKP
jgi:hypothetical protein